MISVKPKCIRKLAIFHDFTSLMMGTFYCSLLSVWRRWKSHVWQIDAKSWLDLQNCQQHIQSGYGQIWTTLPRNLCTCFGDISLLQCCWLFAQKLGSHFQENEKNGQQRTGKKLTFSAVCLQLILLILITGTNCWGCSWIHTQDFEVLAEVQD